MMSNERNNEKNKERKIGFAPIYHEDSKLLILGSFPSVKSREIDFYYGNKQNRFWKTLCDFFQEEIPESIEAKKDFLRRRKIALWDIVISCEIEGSADASIKNVEIADIPTLLAQSHLQKIFLNGTLAYNLFVEHFKDVELPYVKMTSTSPANPRFQAEIWRRELHDVFRIY